MRTDRVVAQTRSVDGDLREDIDKKINNAFKYYGGDLIMEELSKVSYFEDVDGSRAQVLIVTHAFYLIFKILL